MKEKQERYETLLESIRLSNDIEDELNLAVDLILSDSARNYGNSDCGGCYSQGLYDAVGYLERLKHLVSDMVQALEYESAIEKGKAERETGTEKLYNKTLL